MQYDPPVEKRTTSQLMEVIESPGEWKEDLVELTRAELIRRGVSIQKQESRKKSKASYKKRISLIKSNATYSPLEKILIFLMGPFLFILLMDPFLFQAGEGFKRKNKQGLFYLLLGVSLWVLVILISTN